MPEGSRRVVQCGCANFALPPLLPLLPLLLLLASGAVPAAGEEPAVTPLETSVQPFYQLTEKFLDFIQPVDRSIVMSDLVTVSLNGSLLSTYIFEWRQTSQRYALSVLGYAILIAFGLIFMFTLPLAGCLVCCCRCCCGKCGGRIRPMERKGSKCCRVVYGILLTLLATLMLCGVVLAFISNQLVHNSLDHNRPGFVPRRMASGLSGAASELSKVPGIAKNRSAQVISDTVAQIEPVTRSSLAAMRAALLANSGLSQELANASSCLGFVEESRDLEKRLANSLPGLSDALNRLNDSLAELRNLTTTCGSTPDCDWLKDNLQGMQLADRLPTAEFTSRGSCFSVLPSEFASRDLDPDAPLPRLLRVPSPPVDNLIPVLMTSIMSEMEQAKSKLNSSSELDVIWGEAERLIGIATNYFNKASASVNSMVINPTNNAEQSLASVMTAFDLYRYYFYIGLACLALLIVAFFFLGLAFGFCGEPPYEDSRCCNKGVGANLLLAGAGFAFLFGWLIMLFVMTFFVTGAVVDTEVCRHLTGRAGPAGYRALDAAAGEILRRNQPDLARFTNGLFAGLFGECADAAASNRPVGFASALNLTELVRVSDLQAQVAAYVKKAEDKLRRDWHKLAADGLASPESLAGNASALVAAVDAAGGRKGSIAAGCAAAMERPLLRGGWQPRDFLAAVAKAAAGVVPAESKSRWSGLVKELTSALDTAVESVARQRDDATQLSNTIAGLSKNCQNLTERISAAAASAARDPAVFNASLTVGKANLTAALQSVLSNTVAGVLNSAADCAAIGGHLRRAVRAPCVQLLQPFNGYWAGLGAFLVCLLPALVLACKLANLYRKTSKYEKDYQEPDYMAYQGFYPTDTVPLDGQAKPKRRKPSGSKEKARGTSQQFSGGGGSGGGSGQRDSAVVALNRQSQRYSQLPPYAQDSYDY